MKKALNTIRYIVGSLAIVVLGLQAVPKCGAQPIIIPYIPVPDQVIISPQTNGGNVSVMVSVVLGTSCDFVGNWGQPQRVGNSVFVDTQSWSLLGMVCAQVCRQVSTQYNLGPLAPGNYNFVFGASGQTVKTQAFSVPEPPSPMLSIRVSQLEFCWDTETNAWYQLQYRSALTTNQWAVLSPWLPGDGHRFCTNDTVLVGQPQRFYKVVRTNAPPTP